MPRNPSGLHRCENTRPTFASQIYIPCLSRGEADKGEANDGVDPLKREEDVEVGVTKSRGNKVFYAFFWVISGEWETRGSAMDLQYPRSGGALF